MIEVLGIFRQSTETIFRSIFFLDLYLKLEGKARAVQDLHLLGVVAMFLASKLGEVRPLKMKTQTLTQKMKNRCQILYQDLLLIVIVNLKMHLWEVVIVTLYHLL